MASKRSLTTVRARLVSAPAGSGARRVFRPIAVGPAVLVRPVGSTSPWQVPVTVDGMLVPVAPASQAALARDVARLTSSGHRVRITAALVTPRDVADRPTDAPRVPLRTRAEFYGWSLLYQFPDMHGLALVDVHERFPDLPAIYESPLELVDRVEFLERRGIATRPLVVMVQPGDFRTAADGRIVNRFFPEGRFRTRPGRGWPEHHVI